MSLRSQRTVSRLMSTGMRLTADNPPLWPFDCAHCGLDGRIRVVSADGIYYLNSIGSSGGGDAAFEHIPRARPHSTLRESPPPRCPPPPAPGRAFPRTGVGGNAVCAVERVERPPLPPRPRIFSWNAVGR